MAISEATSGQTSGLSEVFVQSYSDHVRCFALDGCEKGTFRFAGLRAFGGFVLAGEWVDGAATELSVYSVRGGRFRIMNPWPGETPRIDPPVDGVVSRLRDGEEAIEFDSAAGQTYLLSAMGATVSEPRQPSTEERNGPRSMRCGDWDAFEPPIAYYPEDLPFGQEAAGDVVFLGMPDRCAETDAAHATMGPEADVSQALGLSGSVDWRARQTAARWLGRWATRETTARLVALAEEDETPVVQYTAGVALVRQRSAEALAEALRIARDTDTPHLRREILKAVSRLARDEEGAGVLAACLGDLALLERVWPAGCMGVPDGTGGC